MAERKWSTTRWTAVVPCSQWVRSLIRPVCWLTREYHKSPLTSSGGFWARVKVSQMVAGRENNNSEGFSYGGLGLGSHGERFCPCPPSLAVAFSAGADK